MKVKIGKYPSRLICNIHSNYMERKYGLNYGGNNNNFEHFLEKIEDTIQYIYNIANKHYFDKKKQKVHVHIDPFDTWSMDETLSHIILPMLKQVKKNKQGSPFVQDEDVPKNIRSTEAKPKENKYDIDEFYHERWDYVIDEMIYAFETIKDSDWEYSDISREERKKIQDRRQKGLVLFGKYFRGIWD